ncbi:MAG: endonuclease/exonuclease/phosphatase family protein [Cyanobacteria bacterium P01_A01_bin.45]
MIFEFSIILVIISLGFLSFGSYIAWWYPLELISHFRIQYLWVSIIITGLLLLFWWRKIIKKKSLFVTLFCLSLMFISLNAVEIIPWYFSHSQQIDQKTENQVKLLSFNVNIENRQYQNVLNVVQEKNPDIALFLEVDDIWVNKLKIGLNERLPYSFKTPVGRSVLFSRLPLKDVQGDILKSNRHNIFATIEINKKPIQFIGTHPLVPIQRNTLRIRNQQLEVLARFVKKQTKPVIVLGDFNLTPWSPYYRKFINKTGLHNTSLGYGTLPTWPHPTTYLKLPKYITPLMSIPIDHCFVSQDFKVANYQVGKNANSDHASIVTDLVLSE